MYYHPYSTTYLADKMRRASFWVICMTTYGISAFFAAALLVWLFQLIMGA